MEDKIYLFALGKSFDILIVSVHPETSNLAIRCMPGEFQHKRNETVATRAVPLWRSEQKLIEVLCARKVHWWDRCARLVEELTVDRANTRSDFYNKWIQYLRERVTIVSDF